MAVDPSLYYSSRFDYLLLILYVFLFSCVPEDECGRVNNKLTIRKEALADLLLTKEALAENSNCDGPNDVCCHEDDILYFYPDDKMCSAIDGYTYVLRNGILLPKLFWHTVRKECSSDREKLLKFEAEGREFAKNLRSLEQFIQTVEGQHNFW